MPGREICHTVPTRKRDRPRPDGWLLLARLFDYFVAHSYCALRETLGSQAGFVNKTRQSFWESGLGQMITRLAETDTANQYFSNHELLSGQRVQVDALGYDISSSVM